MASETDKIRDDEREVETKAAYAGGGPESGGGFDQFKMEDTERVDDMKVATRVVDSAGDEGGPAGPGDGAASAY